MPQQIIWQSSVITDATESQIPVPYDLDCPTTADIPLYLCWETGSISLRITTQLILEYTAEPNDQIFNNPTEYRGGTCAFKTNGYVYHRDYLTYALQLHNYDLPRISISGSLQAAPIVLRNSTNTLNSHAYSLADTVLCGQIEEPPEGVPVPSNFSGSIGPGGICMRIIDGQKELVQIDSTDRDLGQLITLDLSSYFHAYSISGIVRGGFRLTAITTLYALFENSGVNDLPRGKPLIGEAPYPVYGYSCSNGFPSPAPTNPPCLPVFATPIIDLGGQFGGIECAVEFP